MRFVVMKQFAGAAKVANAERKSSTGKTNGSLAGCRKLPYRNCKNQNKRLFLLIIS